MKSFEIISIYFLSMLITFILILVFSAFIKTFFKKRIKATDIVLTGGPAIIVTFFIMVPLLPVLKYCLLVIFILGLLDDIFNLKPFPKLIVEFICAAFLVSDCAVITLTNNMIVNNVITMIWIVFITNAFNLSDNMDGLLTSLVFFMSLFICIFLSPPIIIQVMCLTLIGCCLGFIFFNIKPAIIYLGDSGSLFLGFLFAYISIIIGNQYSGIERGLIPIFLLLTLVMDTIFVSITRTLKGKSIFQGGKDHLSHILLLCFGFKSISVILLSLISFIGIINIYINNKLLMLWTIICLLLFVIGVYKYSKSIEDING